MHTMLKAIGKLLHLSDVHLDGTPDYDIYYRGWRALISDNYVTRFYEQQIAESSSLAAVPPETVLRLTINDLNRIRRDRRNLIVFALVCILFLYVITIGINIYGFIVAVLIFLGIERALLWRARHGYYMERSADLLFLVIRELERNSKYWGTVDYRRSHAADLEVVAKYLERIPFEMKGLASSTRRSLLKTSRAKAQAMRNLQLRAIKPQGFTCSDMVERLARDMCTILEGQWYDLPEEPYERQISRWSVVLQFAIAFILFGVAVALVGFFSRLGPTASVVATACTAIALYILDKIGISAGITGRYARIGDEIISDK